MKIAFIGGGNMASAIIGGLHQGGFNTRDITVVDPNADVSAKLVGRYAVQACEAIDTADVSEMDVIVLAVKPQQLRAVAQALAPQMKAQLVLSIAAGIRLQDMSRWLGGYTRIARSMPNTPALVLAGMTGLFAGPMVPPAQRDMAETILKAVGEVVWVDKETQLDAITALSGSGPAYVFYFMEAMVEAAREFGFSAEDGRRLAVATFSGAAKLAGSSDEALDLLRARVTSKGGTTERAIHTLDEHTAKAAFVTAMRAARDRAVELGVELGED